MAKIKTEAPTATAVVDSNDVSDSASIGEQRTEMTSRKLAIAISALSVCLFVSFLDQTCVSTATPSIAAELNTGASTSWIGASFLIASTSFQLINGRLSDIFGRKILLFICLALMAIGDLLCGFSKTAVQFYAFRGVAGIGGGGINSLVMIIVSDITNLQNRGKYQGELAVYSVYEHGSYMRYRHARSYYRSCQRYWSFSWRCHCRLSHVALGILDDPINNSSNIGRHLALSQITPCSRGLCSKSKTSRLRWDNSQSSLDFTAFDSNLWGWSDICLELANLSFSDLRWYCSHHIIRLI